MAEITITSANFEAEVLKSATPILVDFWATWCGPCQMMGKGIEDYLKQHPEQRVGKVNVDEEGALAQQFGIQYIPHLILFKDGQPVKQSTGFLNPEQLADFLQK